MRTLNCLSDLKKYLDNENIEVTSFEGFKLTVKDTAIGFVSADDKWNVYKKGKFHSSFETKEFVKQIKNII